MWFDSNPPITICIKSSFEVVQSCKRFVNLNLIYSFQFSSHISSEKPLKEEELEAVIEKFFRNLFPLAYHHAVHSRNADDEAMQRDFHTDYKNCLEKSFDTLQPFGEIPQTISRMLVQSVGSANVLLRSIDHGAQIVAETENLPIDVLSSKCQHALLKMNYCASCKGHNYHHSKPCYGYCSNVVRLVYPPFPNPITKINGRYFCVFLTLFPPEAVSLNSWADWTPTGPHFPKPSRNFCWRFATRTA